MRNLHRKAAPRARQPRRVQQLRQALAIERGRHHHDAQVLAQRCLHVERQRQAEVAGQRSEEHTSELQSLMRISYAVFCLKKKKTTTSTLDATKQNTNKS